MESNKNSESSSAAAINQYDKKFIPDPFFDVTMDIDVEPKSDPEVHGSTFHNEELEIGRSISVQSLREQAGKLSSLIQSRTELHGLDLVTPTPLIDAKKLLNDNHSMHSGFLSWRNEIVSADEHGGNFWARTDGAFRAAIGSLITFSVLIFPHQQVFGAGKNTKIKKRSR